MNLGAGSGSSAKPGGDGAGRSEQMPPTPPLPRVQEFSALSGVAEGGKHLVLSWGVTVCGWGRAALRRTPPRRDPGLGAGRKGEADRTVPGPSGRPACTRLCGPPGAATSARPAAPQVACTVPKVTDAVRTCSPGVRRLLEGVGARGASPGAGSVRGRGARCPPHGAGHRRGRRR